MYISTPIAHAELHTLARGKKSRLPIQVIAQFILDCGGPQSPTCAPEPQDDSVQFLKRLFALEDRRGSATD